MAINKKASSKVPEIPSDSDKLTPEDFCTHGSDQPNTEEVEARRKRILNKALGR